MICYLGLRRWLHGDQRSNDLKLQDIPASGPSNAKQVKPSKIEQPSFAGSVLATEPDWSREAIRQYWDPVRQLLRAIRKYQAAHASSDILARPQSRYWAAVHWFWSLVTQSEIHLTTDIGVGLLLPHPTVIITHPGSLIGPNSLIFHHVIFSEPVDFGRHCDIGREQRSWPRAFRTACRDCYKFGCEKQHAGLPDICLGSSAPCGAERL